MTTTAPLLNLDILAAILAAPEDAGPRLEMADWLLENATSVPCPRSGKYPSFMECGKPCPVCHGECTIPDGRAAYAEFVRVQCELAKPKYRTGNGNIRIRKGKTLRRRERELWDAHWLDWFPTILDPRQVRRGFVEWVRCSWAVWHGRECGRCRRAAERWRQGHHGPNPTFVRLQCEDCSGTGRTDGIAVKLCRLSDPCPECKDRGWKYRKPPWNTSMLEPCVRCGGNLETHSKGSGRVLRSVQPGMQPIRDVWLTERPESIAWDEEATTYTHDDYHGITFHLPETTRHDVNW